MFKKIGLPVIALLGILAIAPHQANAAERYGFRAGRRAYAYSTYPVYSAPVYPVAPAVVVPSPVIVGGGWGRRDFRWDRRHDFRYRR